jgi:HEAT repeat protein
MAESSLPVALGLLADEKNPAADAALVEALPTLEPLTQAAALDVLLMRANTAALADVVGRLDQYDATLQQLIVESVNDLSSSVRVAISSSDLAYRTAAIEAIVRGGASQLAYLLADALRSRCPHTREQAAEGLHTMTRDLLDGIAYGVSTSGLAELNTQLDAVAEALATGVQRWEIHLRPKVLEASMWLADRTESAILAKLGQTRTKIAHMFHELMGGTSDPRMAGFLVRALAIPELCAAAADAIKSGADADFIQALVDESWLLGDEKIAQGCRRVRDLHWSRLLLGSPDRWDACSVSGIVGFLMATGGSEAKRVETLRELVGTGREDVLNALVWRLLADESETSYSLLSIVATRSEGRASKLAGRVLRRRRGELTGDLPAWGGGSVPADTVQDMFYAYWRSFEDLDEIERRTAREALLCGADEIAVTLRAKLASSDSLDRTRALRIVSDLSIERAVEASLYQLVSDSDAVVRSLAVRTLASLPGTTAERLLRSAVNDSDPRVQANAVEALDRLNVAGRVACTQPKLESAHSRVRGSAVRSLLRAELREAGDTLLKMLEDEAPEHRLAGLWVVQQLHLQSVRPRVIEICRNDVDARVRAKAEDVGRRLAGDIVSPAVSAAGSTLPAPSGAGGGR